MSIHPIFLLSLPRSGSTLLQRLMSLNKFIETKSEPWIALPLFFSFKENDVRAVYGHKILAKGIKGFVETFPNKLTDFYTYTSEYLRKLYSLGVNDGAYYFLDKTPRYHLIVDQLLAAFPDAKFIFLWRNPLSISASMIQTYGQGNWNLYAFRVDLYNGINSLIEAFTANKNRLISLKYEDIINNPEKQLIRIMNYLGIAHEENSSNNLKNAKKMWGDRTGQYQYSKVSSSSQDKWKLVFCNPIRKKWAKNYIDWIGQERLKIMGYDVAKIRTELDSINLSYKFLTSDILHMIYGYIFCTFEVGVIKEKFKKHRFCKSPLF